jgi:hypothetical protein
MKPSDDYLQALELSKEQHRESKTYSGKFIRPYRGDIKHVIDRLGCRSMIDYGCGKGLQYDWVSPEGQTIEQYWGFDVVKYDPAHPKYEMEPQEPADIVICSHVLTIIPLPDLDWVIDKIYRLSNKAVFIVNSVCSPPQKASKQRWRLQNTGENWTADQWINLLQRRKRKDIEVHLVIKARDPALKTGTFIM